LRQVILCRGGRPTCEVAGASRCSTWLAEAISLLRARLRSIVDLGCGTGLALDALASSAHARRGSAAAIYQCGAHGVRVVGVDSRRGRVMLSMRNVVADDETNAVTSTTATPKDSNSSGESTKKRRGEKATTTGVVKTKVEQTTTESTSVSTEESSRWSDVDDGDSDSGNDDNDDNDDEDDSDDSDDAMYFVYGNTTNRVEPTHPVYNLRLDKVKAARLFFDGLSCNHDELMSLGITEKNSTETLTSQGPTKVL
jgi:hypothetical protein